MKVTMSSPRAAALRLALPAITLSMALLFSPALAQRAHAITRDEVLSRATSWVAQGVRYSQRGSYQGYRRDCSGMVSMAWQLNKSYSSRSIGSQANRIPLGDLRPGDAVLTPGHVDIFGGWVDQRKGTFVAIGQTSWGGRAAQHVRKLARRAVGLRLKSITDAPVPLPTHPAGPIAATEPAAVASVEIAAVTSPELVTLAPAGATAVTVSGATTLASTETATAASAVVATSTPTTGP